MVGGVVSLHTRRTFGLADGINYGAIAADSFGNALGSAFASKIGRGSMAGATKFASLQGLGAEGRTFDPDYRASWLYDEYVTSREWVGRPEGRFAYATADIGGGGGAPSDGRKGLRTLSDEDLAILQMKIDTLRGSGEDVAFAQSELIRMRDGNEYRGPSSSGADPTGDMVLNDWMAQSAAAPAEGVDSSGGSAAKPAAPVALGVANMGSWMTPLALTDSPSVVSTASWRMQGAAAPSATIRSFNQFAPAARANVPTYKLDYDAIDKSAGNIGDAAHFAGEGMLHIAKSDAMDILSRAGSLQEFRMNSVASARSMVDAIAVFSSPNGQAATALAASATRYAVPLRAIPFIGNAATAVGEAAYVAEMYDRHPDKVGYAIAASAGTVSGDAVFTAGGAWIGGLAGTSLAPFTGGLSIPVGIALGGFAGHWLYDSKISDFVKTGITGVDLDKEKAINASRNP